MTKLRLRAESKSELATARNAIAKPFPEMVEYSEVWWHCIHPEWLSDQLTRSLERLSVETVDVLAPAQPRVLLGRRRQTRPRALLDRARRILSPARASSFVISRPKSSVGRVAYYGVSSNTATGASRGARHHRVCAHVGRGRSRSAGQALLPRLANTVEPARERRRVRASRRAQLAGASPSAKRGSASQSPTECHSRRQHLAWQS